MSLFCLSCIPLLYYIRRRPGEGNSIWALPLGAVAVVVQLFFGPLVRPGGFGLSRWFNGFVDITGLPALIPLMVCGALVMWRAFPPSVDYAGFTLLWLFPLAAVRSISGNSPPSLITLIIVPLLWSAQAVGISFFIGCIQKKPRWYIIIPSVLGIAALPIAATTSWWMFFSHQNFLGVLLLLLSVIPGVISILGSREWGVGSGDRCSNYDIASEPYPDNSNNTPHSL